MSGVIAVHRSRRRPAFRPTSLVASPSKKRLTGPRPSPVVDGKYPRSGRSVTTCLPSRRTSTIAPNEIFSSSPPWIVETCEVAFPYVKS